MEIVLSNNPRNSLGFEGKVWMMTGQETLKLKWRHLAGMSFNSKCDNLEVEVEVTCDLCSGTLRANSSEKN